MATRRNAVPGLAPVDARAPAGVGLASERARQRMVDSLRGLGIRDTDVLGAMERVPRHHFVEPGLASRA